MFDVLRTIRIGTMIKANAADPVADMLKLVPYGFESFEPFFWKTLGGKNVAELGKRTVDALAPHDVSVSTIGVFGNPLESRPDDMETLEAWKTVIDNAHHFGASIVAGFTGRLRGQSIDANIPRFRDVWSELARRAADRGVRIAFENCAMDGNWATGDWNIAHTPDAWELMFDAVPDEVLGLEWEPCHQLVYLIDPVPQIRKWAPRIFHVHGKDATVRWDVIREHGIYGKVPHVYMRTPGFGDSDWVRILSELRLAGYKGSIDIEGWHDPVYRNELEIAGQVHALDFLKRSRGDTAVLPRTPSGHVA